MDQVINYITKDAECFWAINELEQGRDKLDWLGAYMNLYMSITYGPENSPRIADCHYESRYFESIAHFADLYIKTHHEYPDPF